MTMFSTSKQLIKNTKNFLEIKRYTLLDRLLLKSGTFYGWGRKKSGFRAMGLIVEHNISKYNNDSNEIPNQVWNDGVGVENDAERVLVIAQTQGDASLKYGMLDDYSTDDMINAALSENPNATVYLKMHPDVLSGKKKSLKYFCMAV